MAEETSSLPEILRILEAGGADAVREYCEETHPAAIAEDLSESGADDIHAVLEALSPESGALILSYLPLPLQMETIRILGRNECARLFSEMPPDDRAHLFRRLPDDLQEAVMPALACAEREDIRRLASYPEGSCGALMTSDYATLSPDITAGEAVERLRQAAPDKETIYYAYLVTRSRRLLGYVSLSDLIVARRDTLLRDIMHEDCVSVRADEDRSEAALKISKFDLIALPVVNRDNAIVGIITHDDVIDVISQEHTEDLEKLSAIGGAHTEGAYLQTSPWRHFRNRVGWVVALGVLGIVAGLVVQHFQDLFAKSDVLAGFLPALTAYMTMLAAAGGNTGNQSSAMLVCGLATHEITQRDLPRILRKEFAVSLMLGACLAAIVGVAHLWRHDGVGIVVAVALVMQVITSVLVGVLLPMWADRHHLDPAIVASPALTTIVDASGLLLYFSIATVLLRVLA